MTYKVIVPGKFPSLNEYINACRTNPNAGNKMKKESQQVISFYVRTMLRDTNIKTPVQISYTFFEANKKRDLDNISSYFHKVFQDTLVNTEVLHDDGWEQITGFSDDFRIDSGNPRIEIEIAEVEA